MKNRHKLGEALLQLASYILVAACSAAIVFGICRRENTKLNELQNIISEKFIGDYDETRVMDAAADAMVEALDDRWSYYIPAAEYEAFHEHKTNSYVGIGVTIRMAESGNGAEIVQVEPDGPAKEAGILPGDLIVKIEDQTVEGMDSSEIKHMIQGKSGTAVQLTVLRKGREQTFSVIRKAISMRVASGQMIFGDTGLVTIANFNEKCSEETIAAAKKLISEGAKSLIFDVRNNGGGFVSEMVDILDYLLPEGELFRSVDYRGKEHVDTSDASCVEMPMAVLINGNSYSAAEFFAAALEEYDWAITGGSPTSGKGRFQYTLRLEDGSAVNLSVGEYKTPKGINLAEAGGLIPQVETPVSEETEALIYAHAMNPEKDPQILAVKQALDAQ